MTLCCDLDLDCSDPVFSQNTLAYDVASPHHVVVQKISPEQTFTDNLNHCCDLDLEYSNRFFSTGHPGL